MGEGKFEHTTCLSSLDAESGLWKRCLSARFGLARFVVTQEGEGLWLAGKNTLGLGLGTLVLEFKELAARDCRFLALAVNTVASLPSVNDLEICFESCVSAFWMPIL